MKGGEEHGIREKGPAAMSSRPEEALAQPVVAPVTEMIDAVVQDDLPAVLDLLSEKSLKREGLSLFGMSAMGIPLGLAASPRQLGLSMAEIGDDVAVAEVRGRNEQGDDVSVSTVVLASERGAWKVDDIWPVPADLDFTVDVILEPTVMFYNGEAQLEIQHADELDPTDRLLVSGLQADGLGLHLLEHGLRFWHSLRDDGGVSGDMEVWAAAVHMCVLALDGIEPDPDALSKAYGVPTTDITDRFIDIARRLGLSGEEPQQPVQPVQKPSGLVDPYGRPLPPSGGSTTASGIILPRG
jgi:hypothetical protein